MHTLNRLLREENGQALVEYGLIIGLISVALVGALGVLHGQLLNVYTEVSAKLNKAGNKLK